MLPSTMIRVVNVIAGMGASQGGPPVGLAESTKPLERLGVQRTIVTTDSGLPSGSRTFQRLRHEDLPAAAQSLDVRVARTRHPRRLAYAPDLRHELEQLIRKVDLVHIHGLNQYPQYAAFPVAESADRSWVVSFHGAMDPFTRSRGRTRRRIGDLVWQRDMLRGAAGIHVTSSEEARLTADVAPDVPRFVVP